MRFLVRLHTPLRLPELVDTLLRAECEVRRLESGELAVDVSRAPSVDQAERELQIYLALWHAKHPEAHAELVRV